MYSTGCTLTVLLALSAKVLATNLPPVRSSNSPLTINNCSGIISSLPAGDKEFFQSYTPQIKGDHGWETWSFMLPGTTDDSLTIFTWTRGDPASSLSNPNDLGVFSVLSSHNSFSANVTGEFVYKQKGAFIDISIENNHLIFNGNDGEYGVWNLSANIQGFEVNISTVPVPPEFLFAPTHNGVRSQLVDGYFTNIPLTRGHTDGLLKYPSGETRIVHDVTAIKHTYALKPIQGLVKSYTRGTSFVRLSHLHWFNAKSLHSKVVQAVQLVVGPNETEWPLIYQATDDPSIFKISTKMLNTTVTLSGCDATRQNPYVFAGHPVAYRGTIVDSARGKTDYYSTITDASIWVADSVYVGNDSFGIIEVYTNPDDV